MTRLLLTLALMMLFIASGVHAETPQMQCGSYAFMTAAINSPQYNEVKWGQCVTGGDANIPCEIWKSSQGTFTVILRPRPDVGCMAFAGRDLGPPAPEPPVKETGP